MVDDAHGGFRYILHWNLQNVVAEGDDTGIVYRAHDTHNERETSLTNPQNPFSYGPASGTATLKFIGQGKGAKYTMKTTWRYVINANGEPVLGFTDIIITCK
jgi:hypothetical protein